MRWNWKFHDHRRTGNDQEKESESRTHGLFPLTFVLAVKICLRVRGKASWWTSEIIHSATVKLSPFYYQVEISVSAEVPVSEENYRVQNFGNRYYPTMVSVGEKTLMLEAARELAAELNRAADKAEAQDTPDQAACGHWAPCDCKTVESGA